MQDHKHSSHPIAHTSHPASHPAHKVAPAAHTAPAHHTPAAASGGHPTAAGAAPVVAHWAEHGGAESKSADPTGILDQIHSTGAGAHTAKAEGLKAGGVAASDKIAAADLKRVLGSHNLKAEFEKVGTEHHIPPALLAGIASRETHGGAALAKDGTGDHGHGYGVMQVDNRHGQNPNRSDGAYGEAHLEQAAAIFDKKLAAVKKKYPNLPADQQMLTATSEYNGGKGLAGAQSDRGTTSGDYGNDTVARAQYYAHHWDS